MELATVFGFFQGTTTFMFVFVCILLILLILIQKGRGGGLVGAFGGMGGNTAFGSKTGDVLTWATSIIFGIFLLLAIVLNLMSGGASSAKAPVTPRGPAAPANNSMPAMPAAPAEPTTK